MKREHKIGFAIVLGFSLNVGLALWMRALSSWRPVSLVAVGGWPRELHVSQNGSFLWVGEVGGAGQALSADPLISKRILVPPEGRAFQMYKGLESFPCIVSRYDGTDFQLKRGAPVLKLPPSIGATAYSLSNQEIYTENFSDNSPQSFISIWNMRDGTLKRRVRYSEGHFECHSGFSPDGKWFVSTQRQGDFRTRLRRYDVQTGKPMSLPDVMDVGEKIRFSPKGQLLLVGPSRNSQHLSVFETSTWTQLWSLDGMIGADWLPDNRLAITTTEDLEWRDGVTGRIVQTRFGPMKGTQFWTTSPDGNWIYTSDSAGMIRRWRAR